VPVHGTPEGLDPALVELLACPACHAPVQPVGDRLVCSACGLRFPIRDGIPVMLLEEAEPAEGET
jgi:uncharacterized protein YbaR (Trm112 family)